MWKSGIIKNQSIFRLQVRGEMKIILTEMPEIKYSSERFYLAKNFYPRL